MASDVESLLQEGRVPEAIAKGFFGDEWCYRLIENAAGGTLQTFSTEVDLTAELGMALSNEDGIATISSISSTSSMGRAGLQQGDIIRQINGRKMFTCEAVVKAIKSFRGTSITVSAVRPPPVQVWRDERLHLRAGSQWMTEFEVISPGACLTFNWQAAAQDILFHIARLGSRAEGSSRRHQHAVHEERGQKSCGNVRGLTARFERAL